MATKKVGQQFFTPPLFVLVYNEKESELRVWPLDRSPIFDAFSITYFLFASKKLWYLKINPPSENLQKSPTEGTFLAAIFLLHPTRRVHCEVHE
jgi:hypothetical protein